MLWVPSAFGVLAAAGLYPLVGLHALWFLTAAVPGFIMWVMFGAIGKKLLLLKQAHADKTAQVHEALIVVDYMQSPGLASLAGRRLQLIPLTGQPVTLALDEIVSVKQSAMLPGKYLVGKIAFHLTTAGYRRLAFAVAASIGKKWARVLKTHNKGTPPGA